MGSMARLGRIAAPIVALAMLVGLFAAPSLAAADTVGPVVTPSIAASGSAAPWYSKPAKVSFTAFDVDGVAAIYYKISTGATTTYTVPINRTFQMSLPAGVISYWAKDNAVPPNTSAVTTMSVLIDGTAPPTRRILLASAHQVGNYRSPTTVTLEAFDNESGVASINYTVDGGTAQVYGVPFLISAEGTHTITSWATDNVGNKTAVQATEIIINTAGINSYEDNDVRFVYDGIWGNGANAGRSGGSWTYANSADDVAYATFTGTGFSLIGSRAPSYGKARVTVDGGFANIVDFYGATFLHKQTVLGMSGLTNGVHTIKIEWTGTNNGISTGTAIGIDALDVSGTMTQAASPKVQEASPLLALIGAWSSNANPARSGGTWIYANKPAAVAYLAFTGTGFDLIGTKAPSYGIARITVDGGTPINADFYDATYLHQQTVASVTGLANVAHTVKIEWTGTQNVASSGTVIGIDALLVAGTTTQATSPTQEVEETSPMLAFSGTWNSFTSAARSGGAWKYANSIDDVVNVAFTGTTFDLVGTKAPTYGIAEVVIDGAAPVTVDFYDANFVHQANVLSLTGLTNAPHTVSIRWTGTRNAASTGTVIGIDAVRVFGTLTQAVATP